MTGDVTTVGETAERVVRDYLGVQPGERFAIVVDERTDPEIPRELARVAIRVPARPAAMSPASGRCS